MLFAGLAASAAIDLLSLLQPEKPKGGTSGTNASFSLPEQETAEAAPASSLTSVARNDPLSLGTLLSAQGQAQAQHKKRSISVLLDLLQSSQDGTVRKSDFEAAAGEGDSRASAMFDRIDQNHDSAVNVTELTSFLETYRRNSEAGAKGQGRALAVAA